MHLTGVVVAGLSGAASAEVTVRTAAFRPNRHLHTSIDMNMTRCIQICECQQLRLGGQSGRNIPGNSHLGTRPGRSACWLNTPVVPVPPACIGHVVLGKRGRSATVILCPLLCEGTIRAPQGARYPFHSAGRRPATNRCLLCKCPGHTLRLPQRKWCCWFHSLWRQLQ